jgi:glucosamine--fructose-6-phosphate aminotransferase (isomerizing)
MAVLFADAPDRVLVARQGSPIVVAHGHGGTALASDPAALTSLADTYATLEDGDIAELSNGDVRIVGRDGRPAERVWRQLGGPEMSAADGDGFEYHTRREIAAQPRSLQRTDAQLRGRVLLPSVATAERLLILASGSALHAAEAARGYIQQVSGLPCDVASAGEWQDGEARVARGTVAVLVCRTGEAGDTLACQDSLHGRGVPTVAVVGAVRSSLGCGADLKWPTEAGPELGVVATKSVTAQMLALLRFGVTLGTARGVLDVEAARQAERAFADIPLACALAEAAEARYAAIATRLARAEQALVVGRGWGAAVAAEGALKLLQLANIHAFAVSAADVGHGALALVHPGVPVLVLASPDQHLAKTAAAAEAIRGRGGYVIALAEASCSWNLDQAANEVVALPGHGIAQMFAQMVAVQLIAYHTALSLGRDVDRPRNLA